MESKGGAGGEKAGKKLHMEPDEATHGVNSGT